MRYKVGFIRKISFLGLVFLLSINNFAAIVSDNDGAAFITKSEFDALKNDFQSQIDQYNQSLDSKIDGAISNYLSGIQLASWIEDVLPYSSEFFVLDMPTNNAFPNFEYFNQSPRTKLLKMNGSENCLYVCQYSWKINVENDNFGYYLEKKNTKRYVMPTNKTSKILVTTIGTLDTGSSTSVDIQSPTFVFNTYSNGTDTFYSSLTNFDTFQSWSISDAKSTSSSNGTTGAGSWASADFHACNYETGSGDLYNIITNKSNEEKYAVGTKQEASNKQYSLVGQNLVNFTDYSFFSGAKPNAGSSPVTIRTMTFLTTSLWGSAGTTSPQTGYKFNRYANYPCPGIAYVANSNFYQTLNVSKDISPSNGVLIALSARGPQYKCELELLSSVGSGVKVAASKEPFGDNLTTTKPLKLNGTQTPITCTSAKTNLTIECSKDDEIYLKISTIATQSSQFTFKINELKYKKE